MPFQRPRCMGVSANGALLFSPSGHEFRYQRDTRNRARPSLRSGAMSQERTTQLSASPPMFKSRFLDFFTRVHPAVPAIVYVPVVAVCIWLGVDRGLSTGTTILLT